MRKDAARRDSTLWGLVLLLVALIVPFFSTGSAQAATTATPDCSTCHSGTTIQNHHSTPQFTSGQCNYCHVGVTATGNCSACHTFGLQNSHHTSGTGTPVNCGQCHSNVGDLKNCVSCHLGKSRTRHHQIASAMGFTCRQCHSTIVQQASGDCGACHTTPVRERHHARVAAGVSCKSCHSSYVEPVNGCKSCHIWGGDQNPHHLLPANNPYGMACIECHPFAWDATTNSYRTQLPTLADCKSCHETKVGAPGSIGSKHHMTLAGQTNQCGVCHQGVTPVPGCTGCHSTANGGVAAIHHASTLYQQGVCLTCHVGADAKNITCAVCHSKPPHHLQPQAYAGDCKYCHSTIQTLGSGCSSCHTASVKEVHHGAPLQNVGGNCGACHQSASDPTVCSNCHAASPHHTTTWSQSGDCAHCHKVPAAQADRPKQAACRECHGAYMHNKGGPIKDFGACAACHSTTPFHAAPASIPGYTGYGAGKKKFNMFWSRYAIKEGPGERLSPNGEDMNDEGGYKIKAQQLSFNKVQISSGGKTYTVPSFDLTSAVSLTTCTRCHSDRKSLVSCTNPKWKDHRTLNRVDLATYQLAETTYLGSLCGSAGSGTVCTVAPTGTYIEAENNNALGTTFSVQTSTSGANGGKYLRASVNSTSSTSGTAVSYTLKFGETGTYYLWFRGNDKKSSSSNSLWYGLNGTRVGDIRSPASDYNWRWVNVRDGNGPSYAAITISSVGTHTLNLWSKEANFELDGIYITKASTAIPGGTSATIPTGAVVVSPSSCGNSETSTSTSTGGGTTETTTPTPSNLALNKSVTASSFVSGYEPAKAVDGDGASRWWVKSDNSHWLRVDLGASQSLSKIVISWGTYYAQDYEVYVSTDGSSWSRVVDVENRSGGTLTHTFSARSARYVRLYCKKANNSYGYSVNEFQVFAQ